MPLRNFAGAVAVITGGASGIGLATARDLRTKGAHVVLADINTPGLLQAKEQIRQLSPAAQGQLLAITTDVINESQVWELMRQTSATCGRIDLVVTCAGIGRSGPIDTFTASDMQTMMNINFMGTYHCVQAALPAMRQQHIGHFVFLSSVAGKLGVPSLSAYCASKWAVRGFASALRAELHGTGIGVTTVYPGWVDTPMIHQEENDLQLANIQALLTPDQVAFEILQAVTGDRRDLTLAPDPDTAFLLEIYKNDPDRAEMMAGASYHKRLARLTGQQDQAAQRLQQ
jgi:NAD(P)-dependent dehydrogenase (short-subunit alcohol dehydrogenase family)